MNKKADVWVSAVIYIGIAITIITIVLASSMPVINRIRDKNLEIETKNILHNLDSTIKDIIREGPGARRTASIKISKGNFDISDSQIVWSIPNSKFMLSQPGSEVKEGNLVIITTNSGVKDEYKVDIKLVYDNILLTSQIKTLMGQYNLIITNEGVDPLVPTKIKISINELTS